MSQGERVKGERKEGERLQQVMETPWKGDEGPGKVTRNPVSLWQVKECRFWSQKVNDQD